MSILRTEKLCKSFSNGGVQQHVIKNLDLEIKEGDFTVIMGLAIRRFRISQTMSLQFSEEATAALYSKVYIFWKIRRFSITCLPEH